MTKNLILVLNGKGGVGKSFFAVNLVQFLKDRSVPHVAIDSDNENSTLKRFHPDADFLDLAQPRALDAMFHALEKAPLVVVDCRAASTDLLFEYFSSIQLEETAKELATRLTVAMPVNHEPDSVDQIQRVTEEWGALVGYLIIRNAVHSDQFTLFDQSAVRQRLNRELGAAEISMTRLQPWLVEALNADNLTITAAIQSSAIHLLDRQRLLMWQRRLYEQLDAVVAQLKIVPSSHAQRA